MLRVQREIAIQPLTSFLILVSSFIISLLLGAVVLAVAGYNPLEVYYLTYPPIFFSFNGITENLVTTIPLILCSLGVAVPAKAGIWNIGIEGQFYFGAVAATAIALAWPNLPSYLLIPLMITAAALAAGLLAVVCVLPRVLYGVSEITTTLLMNYVVILFVRYMVSIKWKAANTYAVQTPEFSESARLAILIPDTRVHTGLIIAIIAAVSIYFFFRSTVWGYEARAIGDNSQGASYAGINISKYFIGLMAISGALSGVAGMLEVSGIVHRLQMGISADYGFSSFVIAWIAMLNSLAIIPVSYVFSGFITAGFSMQMLGLPSPITVTLEGAILLFVLSGQVLANYRIIWRGRKSLSSFRKKGSVELKE